jgi:hypothetical protein
MFGGLIMSEDDKSVPGFWCHSCCAYSDSRLRAPVLAAEPNGDSSRNGYLKYLSFNDNKAQLQIGAVIGEGRKNLKFYAVPDAVAEAAIQAAMLVVTAWYQGLGPARDA